MSTSNQTAREHIVNEQLHGVGDHVPTATVARVIVDNAGDPVAKGKAGRLWAMDPTGVIAPLSAPVSTVADSAEVGNTVTPTTFNKTLTIKKEQFLAGHPIRFEAWLTFTSKATGPGTLIFAIMLAGAAKQALTLSLPDDGAGAIRLRGFLMPLAVGAAGAIQVAYEVECDGVNSPVLGPSVSAMTADTTADMTFGIRVTFSLADVANTIVLRHLVLG